MNIDDYLGRIGIDSRPAPNHDALVLLHRAHLFAIAFENIDVQLGKTISTDVAEAYDKIVGRGRGGWCFEHNGLFGWALNELGFDVMRMEAGVMRQEHGPKVDGNHLCLLVRFPDEPQGYLVDVGFGGAMLQPMRLVASDMEQTPYRLSLRQSDDGYWRYSEDLGIGPFSFDFKCEPANEDRLAAQSHALQTAPDSGFVLTLVAELRAAHTHKILSGRKFKMVTAGGTREELMDSPSQLVEVLAREFGLDVPEVADLWPRIVRRHEEITKA